MHTIQQILQHHFDGLMGSRSLVLLDCGGQEVRGLIPGDPPVREGDRVNLSLQLERAFDGDGTGASLL